MKTDQIIDAAEKHAAAYDGDDRQDIKTDVMNAFYAGVKFASDHPSAAEPVAWDDAERISDLPEVDAAIRGFLADPTGDNATGMVRSILDAAPDHSSEKQKSPADD